MAILLRSTRTGFFYGGHNRWPVDPDQAFDFKTLERATRWIDAIQLADVEIVSRRPPNPGQTRPPYDSVNPS